MSFANYVFCVALIALFLIVIAADRRFPVLRDVAADSVAPRDRSYSLGRVQMAFWTILFIAALIKLAQLKGFTTDVLEFDQKILVLLGISGVTGIVAAAVDVKKDRDVADANAQQQASQQAIGDIENAAKAIAPQDTEAIVRLQSEMAAKTVEMKQAANVAQQAKRTARKEGFFKDLLEDDNGNSLHRLQMILFTLVAGILFLIGTINIPDPSLIADVDPKLVTLPSIPEQILELMGISGGIYVGFKIPGKSTA